MFCVTAKVGSMFAVYDSVDFTVEWVNRVQLESYIRQGVQISGVTNNGVSLNLGITVPYDKCIWTKSRKCIFDVADRVQLSSDCIIVYAEGKKYKGKFKANLATEKVYKFSNGINVIIPFSVLSKFL